MKYRVVVTPKAKIELYSDAYWWALHRDAEQAARWLEGFEKAIERLARDPKRHPLGACKEYCVS